MNRRLPYVGALVAVVIVVVSLAVISTRSSSSERNSESAEVAFVENSATVSDSTTTTEASGASVASEQPQGPYTTPEMPLAVTVSGTTGLMSGDLVSVTATPANGSQAFGVEARLCRGDVAIAFDGQLFPTRAGLCIPKPFAEGTDSFIEVPNQPPYGPVNLKFRDGTGSQTFALQDGTQSTISCDATHPCQLVLKLQYPNGFGFQGVPLTFR